MTTRILFDPRVDLPDGSTSSSPVVVEATPTAIRANGAVVVFPTTLTFTISTAADLLQLAAPGAGQAWRLTVRRATPSRALVPTAGSTLLQRTVTWADAPTVTWAALTDVDPATLAPAAIPTAAWDALQAQIAGLGGGGGAVASVNGHTGVVALGASDVGADPAGAAAAVTLAGLGGLTQTQIDARVAALADVKGAAAAVTLTSLGGITPAAVDARFSSLVNAAPAALDTLGELATQLQSDESAASALTVLVGQKAPIASPTFTGTVGGITKTMVGLGNVDNTSDANKPVSTAQAAADGAVARPVPTYAAPRGNSFDPRTSLYNGLGKLLNFRAKLGLAATGTGICRIGIVGDSTAIGYAIEPKYSWPNILQQSILPALGYPSAGESAYCQPAGTVADSRMTYTGTGVPTTGGALGRNMTAAGSVQFASTVAGTIAEFQLLGEAGTATLSVDGATPGSVTIVSGGSGVSYSAGTLTMTSNTYVHVLLQVTGLANTTHTLKVTWASGQVQTERFAVTNSSGVMVDNMGISGSRTVDWIGGPNYRDTFYTPGNFGQSPLFDLLITGLGVNDANGSSGTFAATAIATYKSNLATIATGNSPGYTGPSTADKLLVATWYNSANPTAAPWEAYVAANYDVSDGNGIPLIDLSARYTPSPPSAMFVDGVHPNRAGAYRIASDIGRLIAA